MNRTLHTRMRLAVGLYEPLVVVVNGSGHARPRLGYAQSSRRVAGTLHISLWRKSGVIATDNHNPAHSVWAPTVCTICHKVAGQIFNVQVGTHTTALSTITATRWVPVYNIILIHPFLWVGCNHHHHSLHTDEPLTSVSMRTGLMPKKGLIAIPGMISASGSEGFGLMQMPPVSGNRAKWQQFI